jgi:hypothetical protein
MRKRTRLTLEVIWSRLPSVANEQQDALMRTADMHRDTLLI